MCDHTTMRISFVIPYFYPALGYGGTPRLAYDMARGLTNRGHQVTVFTTDAGGKDRIAKAVIQDIDEHGLDGMKVFFYRNLSNRLALRHRLFLPARFFRDVRTLMANTDVVHIHDLRSFLSVAAYRAAHALRIPYALSPHGGLPRLGKQSSKMIFDALWGKALLRDSAALCAISPLEERDAKALGIETPRIHPFPPAINSADYRNLPTRRTFASRWGLGDRKIVLFLGRLHWIKGADILIEAISLIPELKDVHVVIAGPDDGAENQLRSLVLAKKLQRRVTFTGFLNAKEKTSALVDSDIVVIPSRREGFPLTILESLACKTPVILTSACDLGNWIQQHPVIRFSSEDSQDLAKKIKAALCDPPVAKRMLDASSFVLDEFSLEALAQRAEVLYQSLI